MKAVLISIQPKWCELIASGKKKVEVRKTKPKLEPPFKCYIYCTKDPTFAEKTLRGFAADGKAIYYKASKGKVIGDFVCDYITPFRPKALLGDSQIVKTSCVKLGELIEYAPNKPFPHDYLYAWHISDLVIYDHPKELSEFYVWKKCNSCRDTGYESTACCYDEDCKVPAVITRPPQSWCYVEEVE